MLRFICPCVVFVIIGVVEPFKGFVGSCRTIKPYAEVRIFSHPSPSASFCAWSPPYDVVAWKVLIVVEQIHDHQVDILLAIHPCFIFCHGMSMLLIERLEAVEMFPIAFFQLPSVFYHINILQALIVGIDIILVASFSDVEHTIVLSVDIDNGRTPCLPIEIDIGSHRPLDDSIAHVEIVEVVASITQCERLIIGDTRSLVREKLIFEALRTKSLVGINSHRLHHIIT